MYLSTKVVSDLQKTGYSETRRYIYYMYNGRVVRVPRSSSFVSRPPSPVPSLSSFVSCPLSSADCSPYLQLAYEFFE